MTVHRFRSGIVGGQGQRPRAKAGILLGEIPGSALKVLGRIRAIDAQSSCSRGHELGEAERAFRAQGTRVPTTFLVDQPQKERLGQAMTCRRLAGEAFQGVVICVFGRDG